MNITHWKMSLYFIVFIYMHCTCFRCTAFVCKKKYKPMKRICFTQFLLPNHGMRSFWIIIATNNTHNFGCYNKLCSFKIKKYISKLFVKLNAIRINQYAKKFKIQPEKWLILLFGINSISWLYNQIGLSVFTIVKKWQ